MRISGLISFGGALAAGLFLGACDASVPSKVNVTSITVQEQMVTAELDAGKPDPARVHVVAEDILKRARGPVNMTVPYLPGGEKLAEKQAAAYTKAFAKEGIKDIHVVTVAVADVQYTRKVVIDFRALAALPPEGCQRIPGYMGAENSADEERYRYGCEHDTILSKMVADPSDLLGKSGSQDGDSRRAGPMLERYKTGVKNEPIQGMNASNIGTNGGG
jgi:type IV pilus biogenesis protein CpaD/CtpE